MSRFQDEEYEILRLLDDLKNSLSDAAYHVNERKLIEANSQALLLIMKTLDDHGIHA